MTCPSIKRIVCKVYYKVLVRSSVPFRGPSHGRCGRIDEAVRLSEPIVLYVRRRQIDPDQRRCGAYPRARQQNRRQRISLEVGVALCSEPGRDGDDLTPGLGDG